MYIKILHKMGKIIKIIIIMNNKILIQITNNNNNNNNNRLNRKMKQIIF